MELLQVVIKCIYISFEEFPYTHVKDFFYHLTKLTPINPLAITTNLYRYQATMQLKLVFAVLLASLLLQR